MKGEKKTNQASSTMPRVSDGKKSKGCLSKAKGSKCAELGWRLLNREQVYSMFIGKFVTRHFAGKAPCKGITGNSEGEGWDRKCALAVSQKAIVQHAPEDPCKVLLWALTALGRHPTPHPWPYPHTRPRSLWVMQLGHPANWLEEALGCSVRGLWGDGTAARTARLHGSAHCSQQPPQSRSCSLKPSLLNRQNRETQ